MVISLHIGTYYMIRVATIVFQAIFGVQIAITMVMASVMSKVGPFMSFARWILTSNGLIRYMHPSDEELRLIALVPLVKERKKNKRQEKNGTNGLDSNVFNVMKQNDLQLETTRVTLADVVQLRYFTEYQWLLDFTFYAIIVYALTEVSMQ